MEGLSRVPVFHQKEESRTRRLSKGERKGWVDSSQYKWEKINTIPYESVRVEAYPENRYGFGKIVP